VRAILRLSVSAAVIVLLIATAFGVSGCASGDSGYAATEYAATEAENLRAHRLEELALTHDLDADTLLAYYHMVLASWRERDGYNDTDWRLEYFGSNETNTLAFAHEIDLRLIVTFRGSQIPSNRTDLRHNFRFRPKRVPFEHTPEAVSAHRGFLEKYLSIREDLHAVVKRSNRPEIVLNGHSAGGALAALAYFDLKRSYPSRRVRAITFGMPRVFNRRGADIINRERDRVIRVVNGDDIVPRLPFRFFGYRHVGRAVELSPRRWYRPFSQYDHHPGYRKELERRAGKDAPWLR